MMHFGCALDEIRMCFGFVSDALDAFRKCLRCVWNAFEMRLGCVEEALRMFFGCVLDAFWMRLGCVRTRLGALR